MNDFTKEELEIIACNLCVNPKTKDILSKLESMIDNYCEHSDSEANHNYEVEQCKNVERVSYDYQRKTDYAVDEYLP